MDVPKGSDDRRPHDGERSLGRAMARGAAAGAFGALAMLLTHKLSSRVVVGTADAVPTPGEQLAGEAAARAGHELSDGAEMAAGAGISLGAGAVVGAVFGVVQHEVHAPPLLHGLLLSGISYALTVPEGGLLPRLGLAAPPKEQSIERAMVPVDAHLAFGVATAAAYEALG